MEDLMSPQDTGKGNSHEALWVQIIPHISYLSYPKSTIRPKSAAQTHLKGRMSRSDAMLASGGEPKLEYVRAETIIRGV